MEGYSIIPKVPHEFYGVTVQKEGEKINQK